MNQLKRIILINSGKVDFYELLLDGNIHFIGTQGTGKSTILRAILFFYNADARKLGISKEKEPFSEYYFPYADSYIVYEVSQENRNFCVWLYKKQNRLCFRFFDGPYERDLFLDKQQARTENQVIEKASKHGYKVHRPIYNFSEYRDIIYGANKSMNRFNILQNSSYHNIPRTITNVFLNSSLDGGFIKTTIINSLSDDPFEINLDKNRHHIETARNDYRDVSEYLLHEKKAQNIVYIFDGLLRMEEEKKELAWKTGAAFNYSRERERTLQDEQIAINQQFTEQKNKIEKVNQEFSTDQRRVQDKLSIVKQDIIKANQKQKEYASKNIEQLLAEHAAKPDYELEQSQTQAQYALLTANQQDIETRYQADKQRLETQCQQQILDFELSLVREKEKLQQDSTKTATAFYQEKERLTLDQNKKLEEQTSEKITIDKKIREVEFSIDSIHITSFLKEEKDKLIQNQQELLQKRQILISQESNATLQKDSTLKEGEKEKELLELKNNQENEKLLLRKKTLEKEISQLQADLQALSGSLLEFLEQNKPDWSDSIGKVISREVLLQNDLQPSISDGNNFYGLYLDTEQLQAVQLSKTELEVKLGKLTDELKEQNNLIQQNQQEIQDQKDKLQKKYNKRIIELNQEIKHCVYLLEKTDIDIERCRMDLSELIEKAENMKLREIDEKEKEKHNLKAELHKIQEFIEQIKQRHQNSIDELESRKRTQEKKVKNLLTELSEKIESNNKSITEKFNTQIKVLEENRNILLKEKGVDISEIQKLESLLEIIKGKLETIEKNSRLIIEYHKDREEYIDRLDEFRQNRKNLENELEHLQQRHSIRINKENKELQELLNQQDKITKEINETSRQLYTYERFSKSQLFIELQNFVQHHDKESHLNCDELIEKLQNLAFEYEKTDKSFTEKITEFSGYFSLDNCLGFEINLSGHLQYRAFANNLKEFVREQKIIDFKTEVTRKYAMVLANIVNETNELLQKEDEVQKIILRINVDFKKSNFVGVVKSIEMRLQDSTDKIIQLLRRIRKFQADNDLNYGEINLFNQSGTNKNNDEAVTLLENLLTQIGQAKSKVLKLEDAFELEFRIRENENDTNWVNRLANVGSNGTDVLVKSMIYINLLHIFKSNGTKQKSDTILHCLIDEVGILHDSNVRGLISFASERNIRLVNGSPNSHNEQDYKHIYMFRKNPKTNKTGITKLISHEL
jgi:hypothetical protein